VLITREKCPFSFVKVPSPVPFTVTETAGTLTCVELSRTFPEIILAWEKTTIDKKLDSNKKSMNVILLLMDVIFRFAKKQFSDCKVSLKKYFLSELF
jgi:hypothetical protein